MKTAILNLYKRIGTRSLTFSDFPSCVENHQGPVGILNEDFTTEEIQKALNSMQNSKSRNLNILISEMFRDYFQEAKPILAKIFDKNRITSYSCINLLSAEKRLTQK